MRVLTRLIRIKTILLMLIGILTLSPTPVHGQDTTPPQWIAATGSSGDTTVTFWFDETVVETTATSTANILLSGGLTVGSISGIGTDIWTMATSMPTARWGPAAAAINGKIYVVGGEGNSGNLSTLEIYDPSTSSWVTNSSMPTARWGASAAAIGGKLYVVGGYDGNYLRTLEVYEPSTDSWVTKTSMPTDRRYASAAVIGGKIYVVGGYDSGYLLSTLEVYDPLSNAWTTKASMPTVRHRAAAAAIDGKLYVVGGYGVGNHCIGTLEVYDPSTDSWTTKASMPTARAYTAAAVIGGKFYVAGGYDGFNYTNKLEVYDPLTDSWTTKVSIPSARHRTASATIGGKFYVVGGWESSNIYLSTLEVYTALPSLFALTLTSGQTLPSSETPVTLTASNISDLYGNKAASLDTTFYPITGDAPTIALNPLNGTFSGDITVSYEISDTEGNPITLRTEYSVDGASSWQAATVTGAITGIYSPDYQSSLTWQSGTDLADQVLDEVWFRITPRDNETTEGVPDSISFGLDNKPPEWIAATGVSGDTTITFWFDEPVQDATATNTSNISLSGGLAAGEITAQKWTTGSSMNTPRRGSACGVIDGKLYVVGGEESNDLQVYDPTADTWTMLSGFNSSHGAIAGVIDGKLYVTGDNNGYLDMYDPVSNTWSHLGNGPDEVWAVAGVIEGKLYMAGGREISWGAWSALHVYDPLTNSWSYKAAMPTARYGAVAGVIDGKFYVAGGMDGSTYLSVLEVYDPATDTWTGKASMPSPVGYAAAGVIHGRLYVSGGYDGTNFSSNLYAYDPATDSWSIESQIPTLRYETTAGVVDDKLYIIGGYYGGYVPQVEIFDPQIGYLLTLTSGQTLPSTEAPVTLTATNITDLHGNTATSVDTTFYPLSGEVPSITIDPLTGVQSGDVIVSYILDDAEQNPINLRAEYSTDSGNSWQIATVTGDTSNISSANYTGSLTWQTHTDLPGQQFNEASFRITPRDHPTVTGTPVAITFALDNKPPAWIAASGAVGDTAITFWFNESVDSTSVTNASNISITGNLTIESITSLGVEEWISKTQLPEARGSAASGAINGKLYIAGGLSAQGTTMSSLVVYNPLTDTWATMTPMPTPRMVPKGGAINGKLYVIGGTNNSAIIFDTLEEYDPISDSWTTKTSMPTARHSLAAVEAINGKLYVAGGRGSGGYALGTLEVYDPATDSWTTKTPMPTARNSSASGVIGGKLYVAGGYDTNYSNTLEVYDPVSDSWETKTVMLNNRSGAASGVLDGKLYVAGGWGLGVVGGYVSILEVYDPVTDSWSSRSSMSSTRSAAAAGVINGMLYMAGGYGGSPQGRLNSVEVYNESSSHFRLDLVSGFNLPFQSLTLQTSTVTDKYGNEVSSLSVDFVPNDENDNPTISLDAISSEVSGDVTISYTISDTEGNLCNLSPAYSVDSGNTWIAASTISDTIGIGSGSYTGTLIWQSFTDLPNFEQEDVRFHISVIDNDIEIGQSDEITFHIDNNEVPSISITDAVFSVSDTTWTFSFTLSDAESDALSIVNEYSTDDGGTWLTATALGSFSDILSSAYSDSLTWKAGEDLPGATQEVLFRITPNDLDEGTSAERSVFVNSLGVPTLEITSDLSAEQTTDITVEYLADDINSDSIDLVFEYEYPVDTWNTATVTGSASLTGPTEYSGSVIWHSGTDMPGLDAINVQFRITPSDPYNQGFAAQVALHVDNNNPPSLSLTSPTGQQARDILIDCQLSDSESDNLSIQAMWSVDKGTTWQTMTLLGDYSNILSGQYSQTVVWKSFDDCGYGLLDSVLVKLIPSDNDPGSEVISGYFKVENYVGDFSGDIQINFSDFATLVTAWNTQNTYYDIGPATGSVPDLIPDGDGDIDFEDLTVYLQMWTWSATNLASSDEQQTTLNRPTTLGVNQLSVIEIERKHPVILERLIPEDIWAPDDGVMNLNLKAVEVTGVSSSGVVLHYDTEHLKFLDVQPGTFLGRTGASEPGQIFVKQIDEEKGRIELMLGRISPGNPATGGSGVLATLQFVKLSKENSTVSVSYDLRDKSADLITSDIYQTTVEATFIPKDFALLQNYPNPFNSETVIRFQLPSEQRVQIYVYNVRGQRVTTLLDEQMPAGYHKVSWSGRNDSGRQVASGVYIYLIQAGQNRRSLKLTILR